MELNRIGWDSFFEKEFQPFSGKDYIVGRVCLQQKDLKILTIVGEFQGIIAGRLLHKAATQAELPVIGDWVVCKQVSDRQLLVTKILPRKSKISRESGVRKKRSQNVAEQVVAANVDIVFIVSSLDQEFNARRLERYLAMVWKSNAKPVIVLNKSDIGKQVKNKYQQTKEIAKNVPVHVISAVTRNGLNELGTYFKEGQTIVLVGSSGVGKSTLINALIGQEQLKTRDIQEYKSRGRHTTTHRQMIILENGGIIIDNPGMRAIQLWEGKEGLQRSFEDIEKLAENCKFNDCNHEKEPDCAVQKAVQEGKISNERFNNYKNLLTELDAQAERKERYIKHKYKRNYVSRMKKKRKK